MSQLQFVQRPPDSVNFSATQSTELLIHCTASVAVDLSIPVPLPQIRWSACDGGDLLNTSVLSNGSLVIRHVDPCHSHLCNCTAEYDGENITAPVSIEGGS